MTDSDSNHENPTTGCACCSDVALGEAETETTEAPTDGSDRDDRWLASDEVLDAPLPDDVGAALGRVLGTEPVETLGAWIDAVRIRTGGGAIAVEDLCHVEATTPHWGELDGERYHFACFYDAVALAALSRRSVAVHTQSPGGPVIEFRATESGDLTDVPDGAVLSFGVEAAIEPPDEEPTPKRVYDAVCPYVRAFPERGAYREWAAAVPAATVAMPLAESSDIARALAE